MVSLKEMCPVFTAFDRLNYLKILPNHFAEILTMPEHIRHCFQQGGFFSVTSKATDFVL